MFVAERSAARCLGLVLLGVIATACGPNLATQPASAPPSVAVSDSPVPSRNAQTPTPTATEAPVDPSEVELVIEIVAEGLDEPIDLAFPGDGSGRVFVVEQAGRIRIVEDGGLAAEPFLDITDRIASGGERGLLGLAFHPSFPDDPRLFVNYTDRNGDTVVAEYQLDASGDAADPVSERVLIQIDQPYPNHNGGAVVFGPDGLLYISTGDGGSGGDPHGNGQRLDTLLGKILRIDIDGAPDDRVPYRIPDDNPFIEVAEARPEIWLTGLRNPWRMRFDASTGDLWIGDVGQSAWEEIDVAPAGVGGLNFGWNRMEGFECFEPSDGCDEEGLTLPVTAYGHDLGCAVIGGVVVRDPEQPQLDGRYLFSDSCSGNLWLIDASNLDRQEAIVVEETGRSISSIEADETGAALATDRGSGELVRIVAR